MVELGYPVILVHGFMDIPALTGVWKEAEHVLKQYNIVYFTPQIPSYGSIEERTKSLIGKIQERFPERKDCKLNYVHIFGHSMGGINARDVAHRASITNLGFEVKTVTTFATPHEGVKAINNYTSGRINDAFARAMSSFMGSDWQAFIDLSAEFMQGFNKEKGDVPGVKYFSWAGECDYPIGLTSVCWPFTKHDGPTDGAVNVYSAKYGTHLGTFPGTDHLSITKRTEAIENTLQHIHAAEYDDGRTCDVFLLIDASFRSGVHNHAQDAIKSITSCIAAPGQTARNILKQRHDFANDVRTSLGGIKVHHATRV